MKKRVIGTICVFMLLLVACGNKENAVFENSEEYKVDEQVSASDDDPEYVNCIINSLDSVWPNDGLIQTYAISITDMDLNGKPELIIAENANSGNYTSSHIYEVNDEQLSLVPISFKYLDDYDGIEEPDIIIDKVKVYENDGELCYIFDDYTRSGFDYHSCKRLSACKRGNVIEIDTLASLEANYSTLNDDMGFLISIVNENGEISDLEGYRSSDIRVFNDATTKNAKIKWEYISSIDEISADLIKQLYNSFSIDDAEAVTYSYYDPDNMEESYEVIVDSGDESRSRISETNTFIFLNQRVEDNTFQCTLSVQLEFDISDIDNAKPGDKLKSIGGNEYEIVSASDVLVYMQGDDSGLNDLLNRTHWLSIGIINDGDYEFLRKTEDNRVVAQYIETDATVVENTSSVMLTIAEDAEIVLDNMTYSGEKLTISGAEFISMPMDYSTQKIGNTEFCLCNNQCGFADINDGIITKFVAEWME